MHRLLAFALVCSSTPALSADPKSPIVESFRSDSSGVLPARVKAGGTPFRSVSWTDDKGDNVAVFSTSESNKAKGNYIFTTRSIFVDVYAGKNGKLKKVRQVKEVVARCEWDVMNEFFDTSVGVTDLDGNGVGELTFAYRTACRSDVSPGDMKLVMLEGPKKHILRGTTRVGPGNGEFFGGDFTPDFKGAPEAFLTHATKVWAKFVNE